MKIRRRSIMASTDKDYASLRGMDFKKARDILTKDGFHEHEYGDKDDNNGYAVYRKGDKEVELQYRWNQGKRKGEAHAGKVTNVYVDDDINSACGKKSVKAASNIKRKPRNVQVYFWHNNAYNAVVMTDGEYWITFDDSFDGIDLYDEDVITELKSYIKTTDFNDFDDMYNQFANDENGNSPVVGDNFGSEFDKSELTHIGTIYEGNANSSCTKKSVKSNKINKRRAITASADSYDSDMQKIQYYAQKVTEDAKRAAEIFQNAGEQFVPIEVPDVYDADYGFYDWYYKDYVDTFDDWKKGEGSIDVSSGYSGAPEINVSYGYFNSADLYNYGDDEEAMFEFVQSYNYMEDLYFVTSEYGHTIEDLANDPYAVFDDVYGDDESEKENAAYEVRAEFDLWTQSDRMYDLAADAQKFVDLYNEVAEYFSYSNAESLLEEYYGQEDSDEVESTVTCSTVKPLSSYEKKKCIEQIAYDYGVSKKQATAWYNEYSDERRRLILDIGKDQAKKAFYED